jgi:hypothetical protein
LGIHGVIFVILYYGFDSSIFRAILHDPTTYPDPDAFKPERFLNADGSLRDDPVLTSTFGFGKRVCPGRHFVDSTLFIVVASLFSVFKVEKGKGTDGGPRTYPFTGGGIRYSLLILLATFESQFIFSAARAHLPAVSSRGIKGLKNLSSQSPWHTERFS